MVLISAVELTTQPMAATHSVLVLLLERELLDMEHTRLLEGNFFILSMCGLSH